MGKFPFRKRRIAFWGAAALALQLAARGAVIRLHERGGSSYETLGADNGPEYFWMLVPESETLDLVTQSAFPLLFVLSVVFVAAAIKPDGWKGRLSVGHVFSLLGGLWCISIGMWGLVFIITDGKTDWELPEYLFPSLLYLIIHRAWPLFLAGGGLLLYLGLRRADSSAPR
jgi:hypothetical protein